MVGGMVRATVHLIDPARAPDDALLEAVRGGDERAFVALVQRYSALMLRVALGHVRGRAVAEEVVQEAWTAVLSGLDGFEGRATFKTWLMRILTNRAKTRGEREARCVPFSALAGDGDDDLDGVVPAGRRRLPGMWAGGAGIWSALPPERMLAGELRARLRQAIDRLPARQRTVISLRDVEGWSPEQVCEALGVSEGNQRFLLHRARSRVRADLERYLADDATSAA
jgi:RNA polymerase sigma-70 factor, ECF subfamily